MTRKEDVQEAIAEARRFIERAEKLYVTWWEDRELSASKLHRAKLGDKAPKSAEIEGGRDHAAMKRASLDLTRALAKMRKGDR